MSSVTKVGIIGCGNISGAYFKGCAYFDNIEVAACADLDLERARAKAEEYNVPRGCSVSELLSDPEIGIVINLTIPRAHGEIAIEALGAGKSVYNEKPLALTREEGRRMLELARQRDLRVGCAPDTFLGAGIQTCRDLIDRGVIGEPVAATAFMMSRGHETWHPDPDFYYQPGGGPMFDMGPYYLTALIALMGPVQRVTGSARITFAERLITSQPKHGTTIKVNVATHVAGLLDFTAGPVATMIMTFDVWRAKLPRIEIYGTEGSLGVPDPNGFGGEVLLWQPGDDDWKTVPHTRDYTDPGRGIGVADMAAAIAAGRPHRASGDLAYHVLDIMHAVHDASTENRHIALQSTCDRPAAMPEGPAQAGIGG